MWILVLKVGVIDYIKVNGCVRLYVIYLNILNANFIDVNVRQTTRLIVF